MLGRTLVSLALIGWIAGCGCRREAAAPPPAERWKPDPIAATPPSQVDEPAGEAHQRPRIAVDPAGPEDEDTESHPAQSIDSSKVDSIGTSGDRTYNTGDCDQWPSYELPLVIEIEIPEFPEEITRRAEPIPDEDE